LHIDKLTSYEEHQLQNNKDKPIEKLSLIEYYVPGLLYSEFRPIFYHVDREILQKLEGAEASRTSTTLVIIYLSRSASSDV